MSSLILLVIVAAWAVVLVPMLLSRHEAANEARSVDRFATAMRVLARRSAASSEGRYVVVPRRPESSPSVVVNGTTPFTSYVGTNLPHRAVADTIVAPPRAGEPHLQQVRREVVMRRRRVVIVLAAMAAALLPLSGLVSGMLWVLQALCDVLLVAYVVHLRRETARMAGRKARAAARARKAAEQTAAALAASSSRLNDLAHLAGASNAVIIERQEDGSWHPVPVPLPTYVTAPMAPPQPAAAARPAGDPPQPVGISTEEDLDRRLDDMQRRLAVND